MKGKTFLAAAILCTALIFGLNGTSSAAELSSDIATMQVESKVLSHHHRHMPPPPPPPHHRYDREYYGRTGYGNRHDNNRSGYSNTRNRKVNININVMRRV